MKKIYEVNKDNFYNRIDKFIRNQIPNVKLGTIFKLIRKGEVYVNNNKVKSNNTLIQIGDIVEIFIPEEKPEIIRPLKPQMKPRPLDLDIIYENDDFLVVNKPSKLSVHPGKGEHMVTLIEGLLFHAKELYTPHLVHRLDKLTSGLIIIAKNKFVSRDLSKIIRNYDSKKYYKALVFNKINDNFGTLNDIIEEKNAELHYKLEKIYKTNFGIFSYLDVELVTGRKHQIRIQFSKINKPLLGDNVYGNKELNKLAKNNLGLRRFFLHAYKIEFFYKNQNYLFEIELPNDLKEVIKRIEQCRR